MPKITVEKQTNLDAKEAFNRVKNFLLNDPDLKKLDADYSCQFDDVNLKGTASSFRFEGDMSVTTQGSGTQVQLNLDLSMMMTPFKGMIEGMIAKKLDKVLA